MTSSGSAAIERSDIDAEAWASLYSTVSRPFAKPRHRQHRVINHYGDEVQVDDV